MGHESYDIKCAYNVLEGHNENLPSGYFGGLTRKNPFQSGRGFSYLMRESLSDSPQYVQLLSLQHC